MRSVFGGGPSAGATDLDVLVEEIADVQPLPPIAAQVLQLAEGETFSAHELAQAISSDPALTARVLRVANSAYYGFPRRITTVRDAVVLLGFRQVRSTTLAACVMRSLPASETVDPHAFWRHAVTVGLLAEALARSEGVAPDEAFTAGILHNIGRLALDQACPEEFLAVHAVAERRGISLHEAERSLFGFTDAEVGGALALRWQFPPDLALAIAHHADPPSAAGESSRLASVVARARAFAAAHGLSDGVDPAPVSACVPHDATLAVMSPLDRPAPLYPSGGDSLEALVAQQGGLEALLARATAFVEHTAARPYARTASG